MKYPTERRARGGPPGREALERNAPRICWHTIFICRKLQWYGKPLKQLGLLSRQADFVGLLVPAASTRPGREAWKSIMQCIKAPCQKLVSRHAEQIRVVEAEDALFQR